MGPIAAGAVPRSITDIGFPRQLVVVFQAKRLGVDELNR